MGFAHICTLGSPQGPPARVSPIAYAGDMDTSSRPTPDVCPLCGQANVCSMATQADPNAPCWCRALTFSADLLARVPEAQRGLSCICEACARGPSGPARTAD